MRKYDIENIFFFEIVNLMVLAFSNKIYGESVKWH